MMKCLTEPKCFLGGYSLTTGCYTIAVIGLVCVPCLQVITWLDDDMQDMNVNLAEYIILSIVIV